MSVKAQELQQWRCVKCQKLLAKLLLTEGKIEIKCACGTLNEVSAKRPPDKGKTVKR